MKEKKDDRKNKLSNDIENIDNNLAVKEIINKENDNILNPIDEDKTKVLDSTNLKNSSNIDQKEEQLVNLPNEKTVTEEKQIVNLPNEKTIPEEKQLVNDKKDTVVEEIGAVVATPNIDENIKEEIPKSDNEEIIEEEKEIDEEVNNKESLVFYQLERMIKEDYYEIKDIEYKVKVLSSKTEEEVLKEEIESLKKELEQLIKEFQALKDKYDYLDISKNLVGIYSLDDNYVEEIVEKYKKEVKNNIEIEELLKKVKETKEYIGIIDKLIIVENEKNSLETKLDDKYEELDIRDDEFQALEEKTVDVLKINEEVRTFTKNIELITKNMENKVNEAVKITKSIETIRTLVPNMTRIFLATSLLIVSQKIPNNFLGRVLKASLIAGAINNMAHIMQPREKTKINKTITYTDYNKEILKNANTINTVNNMVDEALDNINNIKNKFKKDFVQYIDLIPEYKELISNIEKAEEELLENKYYLKKYDEQVKKQQIVNENKKYIKNYELNN